MPKPSDEETTYTQRLSREIDAAYEAYKSGSPDDERLLYHALRAQAANVVSYHVGLNRDPIVADIVHRAMMALTRFRGESAFSTWFWTLAQNEANRALRELVRDRKRLVSVEAGEEDGEPEIQVPAEPVNLDAPIDLEKLVRDLPPEQAEVLGMLKEGHSLEDIAERKGVPAGTIRSRYRLAKDKAKKKSARK